MSNRKPHHIAYSVLPESGRLDAPPLRFRAARIETVGFHRVIYDELCVGVVRGSSRAKYRRIMSGLVERGARAILLGCTEINLLIGADDTTVPLFDTTRLHATRAVDIALS